MNSQERSQLRQLIQDPRWKNIEKLADEIVAVVRGNSTVKGTEWETLSTLMLNEGMAQGIKKLIQEIYAQSNEQTGDRDAGNEDRPRSMWDYYTS